MIYVDRRIINTALWTGVAIIVLAYALSTVHKYLTTLGAAL